MYLIKSINSYINNIISPPFCYYCRILISDYHVLCKYCRAKIKPVPTITKTISSNYNLIVHSVSSYNDPIKSLILAKGSSNYVASKQLAYLMWNHSAIKNIEFDYLIPTPLHWTRYASRGFNQAKIISYELSKLSGKDVLDCVIRQKRTKFQSQANTPQMRKLNVADAFTLKQLNIEQYQNKVLVIVDDLMTTGSTLEAICKVLIDLKPKALYAIVASRTI